MTRTLPKLAAAGALVCLSAPAFAADAVGVWKTEANDAGEFLEVEIAPCGDKLCGDIVAAKNAAGESNAEYENLGRRMIFDMAPDGPGKWDDGEIWAPDDDKKYGASMELNGDVLKVEGCLLVFCRGQDWTRAN